MSGSTDQAPSAAPSFGALLRKYRLASGLTHETLAERAGLSARTISDLERGVSRAPRAKSLALLEDALALTPERRLVFEHAARTSESTADCLQIGFQNLPTRLSSFVGRESEILALRMLLAGNDGRLITLTGSGGTGKTRLAIRVAEECASAFAGGRFFVPLASVVNVDEVAAVIARDLNIEPVDGSTVQAAIFEFLRPREALLVLDNFEHLLSAAPLIASLLAACPQLKVLVTSRSSLRLEGEQEFPVDPLPVPDLGLSLTPSSVAGYAAVMLFIERVRQMQPHFDVTELNAADVAAVCVRLDGLPLAIELAAARIKMLTPRTLLDALDSPGGPLRLLTSGRRDAPDRQRTLRAAIDWSYELLTPLEQHLLRHLAVFVGGITVSTASAVVPRLEASCSTVPLLDVLDSLLDKSLLRRESGPEEEPRFGMLQVIREFLLEKLEENGEASTARERHARHFLEIIESSGAVLLPTQGRTQAVATSLSHGRLAAEQGNMRAALRWLVERG